MSAPQYSQDYITDPTDNERQVHSVVDPHATDYDPGQGNIGGPSYGGMPKAPPPPDYQIPDTFEQANPELSYTRTPPHAPTVYVRTKPARTHRTRNYIVPIVGDPIMIMGFGPQRWKAILSAAALGIYISDDPAGLQGISATSPGNAFPLPLAFTYESAGELFAMAITAPIVLGVLEYIDN